MKNAIYIGSKESKKKVKHIISILETVNENDISDNVAIKALDVYSDMVKVGDVIIKNCNFTTKEEE